MKYSIDQALEKRKILITCGTGGVGKTTVSAAIAIRAAMAGRKVVVVTIDPAKRLATSLGLDSLSDRPTDITHLVRKAYEKAKQAGIEVPAEFKGSLAALMPDTQKTFENFVSELTPHAATAEQVKRNPIFQIFAREFSGTNEYMALERLLALNKQSEFDCIILDTPPSRNTLAFLEAPRVLAEFLDEKVIRWLVLPANKLLSAGMKKALGILEKLTGEGFMTHLFDFASSLFKVQVNFKASLQKITDLLKSNQVGFLIVTAPTPESTPEVSHFIETLRQHEFHFDGLALNRSVGYFKIDDPKPGYEAAFEVLRALQKREQKAIDSLMRNPIPVCAKLPELARDVHSVEDLFHVALAFGDRHSADSR